MHRAGQEALNRDIYGGALTRIFESTTGVKLTINLGVLDEHLAVRNIAASAPATELKVDSVEPKSP